ncbi:zinc finger SWIM domain protein [Parafrankia sp. EAN1pec]|uniref:SWIM zinc finger family protein n=1 Tax=Parafrankia sp. (strain EAN1pec) TaxID=298653 RepID=UPI0000542EA5|nr:zinc finger SWIM domain protein [Frankia sp. EAN1pec]
MMPPEFGATPWGRAWVRTVESTSTAGPNAQLPKARTLARNSTTVVAAGAGHVEADVTVSGEVCRVRLDLPVWSDETQAEAGRLVAKAMAEHRGMVAGDLPDTLEEDLRDHAINIAVPLEEQPGSCSCRARKRPCVHILAVIYALAQLVDERPALAVELRSATANAAGAGAGAVDWIALSELEPAGFYGD